MSRTIIIRKLLLIIITVSVATFSYPQENSCDEIEKELVRASSKIFPYYYVNYDSLEYYSNLFTTKINNYISKNPETLYCPFKALIDSTGCDAITSPDGLFRIYSWDTRLGGTMHKYQNIYQFKSGNKIFATDLGYDEDDFGVFITGIHLLKTEYKTYYLVQGRGNYSTKDAYENIQVYTIEGDSLNSSVPLIKTPEGMTDHIYFDYDFSSLVDQPWRLRSLIRYDPAEQIIYIPVVLESGKVTDRYLIYQFRGKYFEYIQTRKSNNRN